MFGRWQCRRVTGTSRRTFLGVDVNVYLRNVTSDTLYSFCDISGFRREVAENSAVLLLSNVQW